MILLLPLCGRVCVCVCGYVCVCVCVVCGLCCCCRKERRAYERRRGMDGSGRITYSDANE